MEGKETEKVEGRERGRWSGGGTAKERDQEKKIKIETD